MINIFFQVGLAVLILVIINFIGKNSKISLQYVNLSDISSSDSTSYNIFLRILAPSVIITFIVISLYKLELDFLVQNIYIAVPIYSLLLLVVFILTKRIYLINIYTFLTIHTVAFLISFWAYKIAWIKGLNFILPDTSNFRSELWIILILFLYTLLNNFQFSDKNQEKRKHKFIKNSYLKLKEQYSVLLRSEFKDNTYLRSIFFSIMVIEDFNRNSFFRSIEKLLHKFGLVKTTGIMQVKSDDILSDKESILLAQDIIWQAYINNSQNEYMILSVICEKYNKGYSYTNSAWENYTQIKKIDEEYSAHKFKEYWNRIKEVSINSTYEIHPEMEGEISIEVSDSDPVDIVKDFAKDMDFRVIIEDKEKREKEVIKLNEEFKDVLGEHPTASGLPFSGAYELIIELGNNPIAIWVASFVFIKILEDLSDAVWAKIKTSFSNVFKQLIKHNKQRNVQIRMQNSVNGVVTFVFSKNIKYEDIDLSLDKIPDILKSLKKGDEPTAYLFNEKNKKWEKKKKIILS